MFSVESLTILTERPQSFVVSDSGGYAYVRVDTRNLSQYTQLQILACKLVSPYLPSELCIQLESGRKLTLAPDRTEYQERDPDSTEYDVVIVYEIPKE